MEQFNAFRPIVSLKNLNFIEADLRPEFIKRRDDKPEVQIPAQNFNLFDIQLQSPVARRRAQRPNVRRLDNQADDDFRVMAF